MRHHILATVAATSIILVLATGGGTPGVRALPSGHRPTRHVVTRPGATLPFTATAYCQSGVTRSGVDTHSGIVAADPAQLPVGSVVHIDASGQRYSGIYTVLDTGPRVLGRTVDLFVHDCGEATLFGRQRVRVTVLRKGWSPKATAPPRVVARMAGK